jgi:hypothetical protein
MSRFHWLTTFVAVAAAIVLVTADANARVGGRHPWSCSGLSGSVGTERTQAAKSSSGALASFRSSVVVSLAVVAPRAAHAHRGPQFPGFCLLLHRSWHADHSFTTPGCVIARPFWLRLRSPILELRFPCFDLVGVNVELV